jgi:F-type H+-transporting ATPase subunit gamma
MATLRDIQRRIKAVKSTSQITKAMKMVAASKLRKVQDRMFQLRDYADKMRNVIARLASGSEQEQHPLLAQRCCRNIEVLVMTSDRGMCGAFNTNIMKAATRHVAEMSAREVQTVSGGLANVSITTVGKKAKDYYRHRGIKTRHSWTGLSGNVDYMAAKEIADEIVARYISEDLDEVYLVYNEFKNMAQQTVRTIKLLPSEPIVEEGVEQINAADFIFEPSEEELLNALLPKNIEIQIYRALLESTAAEEAARMTAMENATKAAGEMIDTLTLQYNKARQASITAELMDIVGGVEALKG